MHRRNHSFFFIPILILVLFTGSLSAFDHAHSKFSNELRKYVQNGLVDYTSWKTNRTALDSYLQTLSAVDEKEYSSFTKSEKLSFLINAYNAFTIRLILDHYPLKSIKELGGLFSGPWKIEFFNLLGAKKNLDWIEHEKLRKDFQEPRIHFAINCASKGCPPILNESYQAAKLEEQLSFVAKKFLSDSKFNRYDESAKILYLSKIFQWFQTDFTRKNGNLLSFFNENSGLPPVPVAAEIQYLDYDWNLNQRK
ncbi:DUF547 domain-containing protein [Leptospira sp. 201903070]|uniref:DUF547 domain-containing protein n=1 Tax=Leptospira ainlahdjerensis TaxID=2810033 RepID=A0ABS2U751_9LEPT|nr:DUF547 domain-containing protein [Leptospira ainlahdjerensis]MBM9576192.1 DUF547 domain-containing protein [Leptospira ainlahdjerensis]